MDKKFLFEVRLNWIVRKKGLLSARDVNDTLHVATPPVFGGEDKSWTPEHLFLGSISSCYMTTFLAFAEKLKFNITRFECPIIGQISLVKGRYIFLEINLYPKIYIIEDSLKEKVALTLEKTHKYCIITNSISAPIFYNPEILIEETEYEAL
jgi:organic hydroperoxide reductase OsmC/OhrA